MRLKIRLLLVRIVTPEGIAGVRIPFEEGLVVIRAENTTGKSTCLQSILYALGLEGMLSAKHEVPLPPAVTQRIELERGHETPVLESEVLVEIENDKGEIIAVRRPVAGASDNHLVTVWEGPALSAPEGTYDRRDYFVRIRGSATRMAGFHTRLASFVEWKLPIVPTYSGSSVPLYMEAVFPLMFIEQKRGWSSVHPRFPTHFGIREVGRRAVEFLLRLDAYVIEIQRESLKEQASALRYRWREAISKWNVISGSLGGVMQGLPENPIAEWPPAVRPGLFVAREGKLVGLDEAITETEDELKRLEGEYIPRVNEIVRATEDSLAAEEARLRELEISAAQLLDELELERLQVDETDERLQAIEEDLRQNQDSLKLRELGSAQQLSIASGVCPTCRQSIDDSLLSQEAQLQPMTLEENIKFLQEQRAIFRSMRGESERLIQAKSRQLDSLRTGANEVRSRIRALKETLTSRGEEPSIAAIEQRFRLRERIEAIRRLRQASDDLEAHLINLSEEWRDLEEGRLKLPKGSLSEEDEQKLRQLEAIIRDQLQEYGFSSRKTADLSVSREAYHLVHEGFDLQFEISASDVIRALWSYVCGLLELSRSWETNHLGLVIVDEPRQQDMSHESLAQFLYRSATSLDNKQQIIFATSADENLLSRMLVDVPHQYHSFEGRILRKME